MRRLSVPSPDSKSYSLTPRSFVSKVVAGLIILVQSPDLGAMPVGSTTEGTVDFLHKHRFLITLCS